eukprot:m.324062 g.324062  ORF g.324062 m.324062 type:complete len:1509 (-) comp16458_c0_seq19:1342-5868(-)
MLRLVLCLAALSTTTAQWTEPFDVVLTHPADGATFNTGESVLIQWIFNPATTDLTTFRIDLFTEGSLAVTSPISQAVTTSTGSMLYTFPGSLPTGNYWFGVSSNLILRGYGPYPNNGTFGSANVRVTAAGSQCSNHTTCASDEYCDRNAICTICDECFRWFDAIDFVCPTKCGVTPPFVVGTSIPPTSEAAASGELDDFVEVGCPAYNRLVINTNPDLTFAPTTATDEPNRMSVRLRDKLQLLTQTLNGDGRFDGLQLHVRVGYKLPPTTPGAVGTLHHAGRAVEITMVNLTDPTAVVPDLMYEFLGRVSAFTGVDYVLYLNANTIYLSVIPDGCRTPLDLALLLDGSGSIEMPQFGGAPGNFANRVLGFAKALVPFFEYGPLDNQTRMSVTTFASSSSTAINFHFNEHESAAALLTAIDGISYPSGGTATSVGLNLVRTQVFTTGNGMRAANVGIPRVTIVITDGQSNSGFAPRSEALQLKGDPTNAMMISIGVGTRYSAAELIDMASEPVQQNVYTLKSFDRIPTIVDKISFTACQSRPIIDSGTDTNGVVGQCEFVFFRSQCGHLQNSVVEVTSLTGNVHVYVDNTTSPGPFRFMERDESTDTRKTIIVDREPGETSPLFIGIKGIDTGSNTFTVRVFSNFFTGSTTSNAVVAEDAANGFLVFQPQFTPGATYTILDGNDAAPPKFAINSGTGAITVNSPLDFESNSTYSLRVSAVNNVAPCQNGIMFVNINVTDVNDQVPTFAGAPFSASVALNTPAGFSVLNATASDTDGGSLVYSLAVTTPLRRGRRQTPSTAFVIDSATGEVSTNALIDGSETNFDLTISASDGTFTGTASATVSVTPCDTCPAGQFVSTPCGGGGTTVGCSPVTPCGQGTFMAADATPNSNRDCQPCPTGTFQDSTAHTDPSCTAHTVCGTGFIATTPGTAIADTVCGPLNSGPPAGLGGNPPGTPTTPPTAPTAAPSAAPTAPTAGPTSAPTLTPTTLSPTAKSKNEKASGEEANSEGVLWWPALLVLLLLLLLLGALLMRNRNKVDVKDVTELGGNPLYGDFQMGQATAGRAALLAAGGAAVLGSSSNPLWQAFRRCVAFDSMYYGNPPLVLDDDAMVDVYHVLQLPPPDATTLGKLRTICGRFLGSEFKAAEPNEPLHDDVNDFFWSAIADEMVERAIDALARAHTYDEATGGLRPEYDAAAGADLLEQCLSELSEDYVPEANGFLVPVDSNPALRQLPPGDAITDNVYEVATTSAHAELDYALASGAAAVNYDVANQPSSLEYAVSDPTDHAEDVYTMASNMDDTDVVYDIGGVGAAIMDGETVYDLGSSVGAGSSTDGAAAGEAIYDNQARKRLSEAVYDFGSAVGEVDVDADEGGAIYDNNPARLLEADDVVYDIGSNADGYLGVTSSDPATYDLGSPSQPAIADAVYDLGTAEADIDATYHSRSASQKAAGGGARADPMLSPEVYTDAPTYDLGGVTQQPVATYELAGDAAALDASVKLRSRSYDNALNDAAV